MDAGQMVTSMNIQALKEPRGFIRFIEVILAIFAFATTCSVTTSVSYTVKCTNTSQAGSVVFGYPFKLEDTTVTLTACNGTLEKHNLVQGAGSSSQFYVFIGVMAFLYSLAAIVLYVCFDELYRKKNSFIIADFLVTIVFTAFWLISASAWAQGVSDVKYYTDPDKEIFRFFNVCKDTGTNCLTNALGNFASLNVSIIFGFLNMLVWGGNIWFLYKETPWFKGRENSGNYDPNSPGMPQGPVGGSPTSQSIP